MKNRTKSLFSLLLALALVIGSALFSLSVSAENEKIDSGTNISDLQYASIGTDKDFVGTEIWGNTGSMSKDGDVYTLKSGGWATWYGKDSFSFAYKKYYFNYGKKASFTCEMDMLSFDGSALNAGAGLMIRSSLDPAAANVSMHFRPGYICATHRAVKGADSSLTKATEISTASFYPAKFKLVLEKNKISCYYMKNGDKSYTLYATAPFAAEGNYIYFGASVYSTVKGTEYTTKFQNVNYELWAPEGTKLVTNPDDDNPSSSSSSEEPELVLPEDPPVGEDVLLSETFTDNSITDGEESVTNPIWRTTGKNYEIYTDEVALNRYMKLDFASNLDYFYAGSKDWTDYEMSAKVRFTKDTSFNLVNGLYFYVRHTDFAIYGNEDYYIGFVSDSTNNAVSKAVNPRVVIGQRNSVGDERTPGTGNSKLKVSKPFDYLSDIGTEHTVTIRAFDNCITVYWDGEEIASYVDDTEILKGTGGIGFSGDNCCVEIDDIKVIKLEDLLGGDYDNIIGGGWDTERPKYLDEFGKLTY